MAEDLRHHTLSVLVENKAGVLARIVNLFSRRAYNIYSLAVAPTEDERFSRLTVVVDVDSAPLEQIVKQLNKLINVVKIVELDPNHSVERELMIATVRCPGEQRHQVTELVRIFEGKILAAQFARIAQRQLGIAAKGDANAPTDPGIAEVPGLGARGGDEEGKAVEIGDGVRLAGGFGLPSRQVCEHVSNSW